MKGANPCGKLWDKYVNQKSNRKRLLSPYEDDVQESDWSILSAEFDESVLLSLKTLLSRNFSDWDDVKDKWQRTFLLRQKELKTSQDNFEFLKNWPLYSDVRASDLINIDFELLYPKKSHLLLSKWNEFTQKIGKFYHTHIKDNKSKEVLARSENINNQNSLDIIYTILLNSIILQTARFSNKNGKNVKKISIPDANECFVVHLTAINDYEKVITELREKYYSKGLTVQPFVIVVGNSIHDLDSFYIYFDNNLLKVDSFLKSLDICLKIFNTLSLKYPKGCHGACVFIQEYFYEIKCGSDIKAYSIYQIQYVNLNSIC